LQDDPSRKLMRQIFGAIAEYEKTMIVLKLRGARARARAGRGRCEGRKPFGYYEGEATVLERFKSAAGGRPGLWSYRSDNEQRQRQ
jgi:DNA invertase Pin-like site-specific DNA recombinase